MTVLACVSPTDARKIWPQVSKGIRKALERGGGSYFKEVEDDVLFGKALLWLAIDNNAIIACCVTKLVFSDFGKKCMIVSLYGEHRENWFSFLDRIEQFARDEHCKAIELCGRKGWARVLKDYRQTAIVLQKRLD